MATDQRWGEGGAERRALECMGHVLDLNAEAADRSRGLRVMCWFGAELVGARAVGHVRYDRAGCACQLCVWRTTAPDRTDSEVCVETAEPREWWAHSPSRRRLYDLLDCEHLAELPLSTQESTPSLLILARDEPFDQTEGDRLATARGPLLLLERLVDALLPAAPLPLAEEAPDGSGAALTSRETEVLALLGQGLLARSIATRLEVSERTVHKHLGSIYRKLGAHDRLLAVRQGESMGLISPTNTREPATGGSSTHSRAPVTAGHSQA